jgi:glycosyltransferase involved in cell wall biosynthesis
MNKLVSIITYSYNGESFIGRFLDSILNQSYNNIELIFINDGSSDKTEEIFLSYKPNFDNAGIKFKYFYQKNKGQAFSLNKGLKEVQGEYITWPDSDDFLEYNSIEDRVDFLEKNAQYGFVRSDGYILKENNLKNPTSYLSNKNKNRFKEHLFDDFINEHTYFAPGCYLTRTSAFIEINPNKTIYISKYSSSQNYQMLLPLACKFKCGFIDKPLLNYVHRDNSYSHSFVKKQNILERFKGHEDIIRNTIAQLNINQEYYDKIINQKYLRKKLNLAKDFNDFRLFKETYNILTKSGSSHLKDHILYMMTINKIFHFLMIKIKFIYIFLLDIYDRFSKIKLLKSRKN